MEVCNVCGKVFNGEAINVHGSYEYIKHTNFSNNIHVIFARTKNIEKSKRVDAIVKEFFDLAEGEKTSKSDHLEFLECFKHYKYDDTDLLEKVFEKIKILI